MKGLFFLRFHPLFLIKSVSVGFVEHGGYTVDPEYHHVGDLVNRPGYDIDQILYIGKAVLASLAEIGELL